MSNEVETVARVICRALGESPSQCRFQSGGVRSDGTSFYECHERMWERYGFAAVAAIAAMERIRDEPATSGENISPPKAAEIDTELLDWKY
jgi:hypothetical protein